MSENPARTDFEALLEPLLPAAFRAALHFTGNRDDAEDLVQDAAVQAYRAFQTFTPGTNFRAWFFRVLTNAFYQTHRKKRRQPDTTSIEDAPPLYLYSRAAEEGLLSRSEDPAALVLGQLDRDEIGAAIQELPEEYRLACALYFVEEFSYQEVAEVLDCPVGTVRSRLHRGRRLLQKRLWQLAQERGIVESLKQEAI
jgi:RNA polymerase sigma-70 factor, ECF subfamily